MHRIDNSTASQTLPAVAAAGTPGYFSNGDPFGGIPSTILDADLANALVEEPMAFLAKAGVAPVKGRFNQVLQSCQMMFGVSTTLAQTQATGNFTVPDGIYFVRFSIRGGGGGGGAGGGNSSTQPSAGGGAGAGGSLDFVLPVQPGNNVSWVIGASGSPGVNNGSSGGIGGDTVVYLSGVEVARASGGQGGINATLGGVGAGGAGGGFSVQNNLQKRGYTGPGGGYGEYVSASQARSGIGAPSFGMGSVQVTGSNSTGINGAVGGGGSGGTGTSSGGSGGAGEVCYEY